jgi:CheY-like chemotaxis protein
MKFLIVDDEPDMLAIVGAVLRRSGGHQTVEVEDPLQASGVARRERPDAILMDVQMDGMDGPEVLTLLRQDPATSGIPVIFVTGGADPEESARLRQLGARGVIAKPISPATLAVQVRAILNA